MSEKIPIVYVKVDNSLISQVIAAINILSEVNRAYRLSGNGYWDIYVAVLIQELSGEEEQLAAISQKITEISGVKGVKASFYKKLI